jgi:hypothetical protein
LAARAGFYLLLAYLAVRIAVLHGSSARQADANGALAVVTQSLIGEIAVAAAAVGFASFGAARLYGAWHERGVKPRRRLIAALQGGFYLLVAYLPASFLGGRRQAGSEQAEHTAVNRLLSLPGGQVIVIAGGLVILTTCGWQIRTAATTDFRAGLELRTAPGWVRRLATVAGVVGIAARAVVFVPLGVFLILAGATFDPARAHGLDGELRELSTHAWGVAIICAMVLAFVTFAGYSLIEARYRKVKSAR